MRITRAALLGASMANSRFQYVKKFELADAILPDTHLVVRLDGHMFTRFTADHGFTKPNDERGLLLMAECARQVMSEWTDLTMAFGQSDEFSFLLPASSSLYNRRSAKISTSFVSLFSSSFVFFWPKHFPDTPLQYPPNFDARVVAYPSVQHIRDYFAWRQADCHINNLYNTCFWSLVAYGVAKGIADGESKQDAQVALKGTSSGDKNELLFSRFGVNYNDIPQRFRKGTTLYRTPPAPEAPPSNVRDNGEDSQVTEGVQKDETLPCRNIFTNNKIGSESGEKGKGEGDVRSSEATMNTEGNDGYKESVINRGVLRGVAKVRKKSLKKGHAPPGAIEEVTSDIIRDEFWDRNPHLLM